jgi:negative regulator of sigma E activity
MSSEMLSAALDGELSPAELDRLLDEVERSPELKLHWSRMCLARDALNGAQVQPDRPDIVAGVMAGLGAEAPSTKVVPLVRRPRRAIWRPAIGLASAASVASIAFFLGYRSPSVPPVVATSKPVAAVVATAPAAARQVAAVSDEQQARPVPAAMDSQEEWDSRQLNRYLMDYSSYRAGAGMADTLGYARFAAHTAEYTPEH